MNFEIITKRPEGMDSKTYKILRKESDKAIKDHLKGKLIHMSSALLPRLDKNKKVKQPVEWIGKTKGKTYVNEEKQAKHKIKLSSKQ